MAKIGYDNTMNKKGGSTPLFVEPAQFNTSYTDVGTPDYEGLAKVVGNVVEQASAGYEDTKNKPSTGPLTYNEQGAPPLYYNEQGAKPLSKEEEKIMMGDAIEATHSEGSVENAGMNLKS